MSTLHSSEAVAAELKARVLTCTVALGAETDLGVQVFQGRRTPDVDMMPCSVIIEGEDDVGQRAAVDGKVIEVNQHYAVLAYLPCDRDNPNATAHKAIRDLKRAIFRTAGRWDRTWGGKVRKVQYLGRDIGARVDGEAFVLAVVEVMVEFAEDLSNP